MKKLLFLLLVAIIYTFSSCSEKKTEEKKTVIDTIPMMVMQIQKCNRLYTTEIHVHKIVTHDDQLKLKGSIFKKDFNINVPGSNRKVAIPMDATLKAYIDFKDFGAQNISRKKEKIEITLPDPKIMLTSSKIDHEGVKQFVSLTRRNFSDAELSLYEQQGREGIIKDIPNMEVIETARQNAANIEMGFKEENIKITFRKKFSLDDLKTILDNSTIEKKTN